MRKTPYILGPREHHLVRTAEDYRRKHRAFIEQQRTMGSRVEVHNVDAPLAAYVSANQWVVDCECGAGNAVEPGWATAHCFACGAVHPVVFPKEKEIVAITSFLLARPDRLRGWAAGEPVSNLYDENVELKKRGVIAALEGVSS